MRKVGCDYRLNAIKCYSGFQLWCPEGEPWVEGTESKDGESQKKKIPLSGKALVRASRIYSDSQPQNAHAERDLRDQVYSLAFQ